MDTLNMIPAIPSKRTKDRGDHKAMYAWDHSWPPDVAAPKMLEESDEFSIAYLARVVRLNLQILHNHVENKIHMLPREVHAVLSRDASSEEKRGGSKIFATIEDLANSMEHGLMASATQWIRYFSAVEKPPIVTLLEREPGMEDRVFAWQRVAGTNPMIIRRVTELPASFPVTETHYRAAVGGSDTLAAALAEGRAFLADYSALHGAPFGNDNGRPKWATAPLALFAVPAGLRELVAVAIQMTPTPDANLPIVTPADGVRWKIARHMVQIADGILHEAVFHLGQTHLVVGIIMTSQWNQLDEHHPIRVLLEPHGEFTLDINDRARKSLIAPRGIVDRIVATTIESTASTVRDAVNGFVLARQDLPTTLAARGVDDANGLPDFPYRDDGLPVWHAIHDFVTNYVALYYESDAEVDGDIELRAWFAEMGSSEGGRLPEMSPPATMADLSRLAATIIFTATAQHSTVNFGQYPYMAYAPNMPGAAWSDPAAAFMQGTEEAFVRLLPPIDMAALAANTVFLLSNVRENILGDYHWRHFADDRVKPLVATFKQALESAEAEMRQRDATRLLPFPFLHPSTIPNSIHI